MMAVLFGVILPILVLLGAIVLSVGSWYTHARHLQTKVDAAAFAGGGSWAFPCAADIDAKIEDNARQYVGEHTKVDGTTYTTTSYNPQIGKVRFDQIHAVLNGPNYYDADEAAPTEKTAPAGSICEAKTLDVKATEQDTPLLGWRALWPDLKRKARVEIQEVEGITGLIPIAMRAPEPVSAAAVYYNETTGNILAVKYFVKASGVFGIPAALQGWSTYNSEDSSTWASFVPTAKTGVAVAISFRGACNTNLPSPNTKIQTGPAPCFEDAGFTTVNQLCNQASSAQIVNCYFASGSWPSESVQSGLHFIRGYPEGSVGAGRPDLRSAWIENVNCPSNGYFSSVPGLNPCRAKLTVKVDVGSLMGNPAPNPPNNIEETRNGANTQVRYCLVRASSGTQECRDNQFDVPQDMTCTGPGPEVTCSTNAATHLSLPSNSLGNAIAIEVKLRRTTVAGRPGCTLVADYNDNCRWFYNGAGFFSLDTEPTTSQVLAVPVQRAFRGNSGNSSSVRWLRLTTDQTCDAIPDFIDHQAASQPTGANRCFFVDMGLKGGVAVDQDEPAVLFDDGTGTSQVGAVDCDPNIPQGQVLEDGVIKGCGPWYAANRFDTTPLCPGQNQLFATPNPGPPWQDWPPIRCIKTRPTGQGGQMDKGFNQRFFGDKNNPSCPTDSATGYVKGRNYWHRDNNLWDGGNFADNGPPQSGNNLLNQDPRLVTIFLAPTWAFTGSGQNTYPITGFVSVYVTGYGRVGGNGSLTIDDPCPGNTPPPDLDLSGGSSGGYVVWGHIIKGVVPTPNATPSGVICQPAASHQPCVAVLVE